MVHGVVMTRHARTKVSVGTFVYIVGMLLLWPDDAWAWGPVAHVHYGLEILRSLALLAPAMRALLAENSEDYLYGCCAADIVVGKNFARYANHCHNWQVALRLLDAAKTDAERALSFGFLTHLSADIIAHNFFVPYKSVESFRNPLAKHTYWELRFDRTLYEAEDAWKVLGTIARSSYPSHDEFLEENLVGASRLFSFSTSRRVFGGVMLLSRLERWKTLMTRMAERSTLPLTAAEADELREMALEAIVDFLRHVEQSKTVAADATGDRALRTAKSLRRELLTLERDRTAGPLLLSEDKWRRAAEQLRGQFRAGIFQKLDVPELHTLLTNA
jgi:hypothetical protein